MKLYLHTIAGLIAVSSTVALAECIRDLADIDNSSSLDGKPIDGHSARTPEDFAVAAINRLYANDPNNTIEKIVIANDWSRINDRDMWGDINHAFLTAIDGGNLPEGHGELYNHNFAVCADNGQCAQIEWRIQFDLEDNVESSPVNWFIDHMLRDSWEGPTSVGMAHVYVYDVNSYTVNADLAGDTASMNIDAEGLRSTIESFGALVQPSSYGTAAEQAAMEDKTCRHNDGSERSDPSEYPDGDDPWDDFIGPYDDPWAEWEASWGFQVRCYRIEIEDQSWGNCD